MPPKRARSPSAPQTPTRRTRADDPTTPRTPLAQLLTAEHLSRSGLADKSARKKSARNLIRRAEGGDDSEGEDGFEEEGLEREIYGSEDGEEEDEDDEGEDGEDEDEDGGGRHGGDGLLSDTEAGIGDKVAGKGKGRGRKRAKSPEVNLAELMPHEVYFEQHRRRAPISTNTVSRLPQMDAERLYALLRARKARGNAEHESGREVLLGLHEGQFPQWVFELEHGFNICLYGYGSKKTLLQRFLTFYSRRFPRRKIICVNGYLPSATAKDLLSTILVALLGPDHGIKIPLNPADLLPTLSALLSQHSTRLLLAISSLDAEPLRAPKLQSLIALLAADPNLSLVATTDHILAPLLWDASLAARLNFAFHDGTTHEPYVVEAPPTSSLELGRGGRAGGIKGVRYVLASLPQNAKELFRILVAGQLERMVDGDGGEEEAGEWCGVDARGLYQQALEEFVCSNEIAFRSLLKEFQDHQMVTSRKDIQGTEILWSPFRKEELESILEEVIS